MTELRRCPSCGMTIGGRSGGCSCHSGGGGQNAILWVIIGVAVIVGSAVYVIGGRSYGVPDVLLGIGRDAAGMAAVVVLAMGVVAAWTWFSNVRMVRWLVRMVRLSGIKLLSLRYRYSSSAKARLKMVSGFRHLEGSTTSYRFLLNALRDTDPEVRKEAVYRFCGQIGPLECDGHERNLVALFHSECDRSREHAADAIFKYSPYSEYHWGLRHDSRSRVACLENVLSSEESLAKRTHRNDWDFVVDYKENSDGVLLVTVNDRWKALPVGEQDAMVNRLGERHRALSSELSRVMSQNADQHTARLHVRVMIICDVFGGLLRQVTLSKGSAT